MSEQPKKPRAPKKKRLTVFLDNEADEKLTETVGTSRTRRAGFVRWLMDQVFGGSVPRPTEDQLKPYLRRAKKEPRKPSAK
mgnify:CR=1|jgi:hypothetical protein